MTLLALDRLPLKQHERSSRGQFLPFPIVCATVVSDAVFVRPVGSLGTVEDSTELGEELLGKQWFRVDYDAFIERNKNAEQLG